MKKIRVYTGKNVKQNSHPAWRETAVEFVEKKIDIFKNDKKAYYDVKSNDPIIIFFILAYCKKLNIICEMYYNGTIINPEELADKFDQIEDKINSIFDCDV